MVIKRDKYWWRRYYRDNKKRICKNNRDRKLAKEIKKNEPYFEPVMINEKNSETFDRVLESPVEDKKIEYDYSLSFLTILLILLVIEASLLSFVILRSVF